MGSVPPPLKGFFGHGPPFQPPPPLPVLGGPNKTDEYGWTTIQASIKLNEESATPGLSKEGQMKSANAFVGR